MHAFVICAYIHVLVYSPGYSCLLTWIDRPVAREESGDHGLVQTCLPRDLSQSVSSSPAGREAAEEQPASDATSQPEYGGVAGVTQRLGHKGDQGEEAVVRGHDGRIARRAPGRGDRGNEEGGARTSGGSLGGQAMRGLRSCTR